MFALDDIVDDSEQGDETEHVEVEISILLHNVSSTRTIEHDCGCILQFPCIMRRSGLGMLRSFSEFHWQQLRSTRCKYDECHRISTRA